MITFNFTYVSDACLLKIILYFYIFYSNLHNFKAYLIIIIIPTVWYHASRNLTVYPLHSVDLFCSGIEWCSLTIPSRRLPTFIGISMWGYSVRGSSLSPLLKSTHSVFILLHHRRFYFGLTSDYVTCWFSRCIRIKLGHFGLPTRLLRNRLLSTCHSLNLRKLAYIFREYRFFGAFYSRQDLGLLDLCSRWSQPPIYYDYSCFSGVFNSSISII